jgi:hypothetical protein
MKFGIGQPMRRHEDLRIITGLHFAVAQDDARFCIFTIAFRPAPRLRPS